MSNAAEIFTGLDTDPFLCKNHAFLANFEGFLAITPTFLDGCKLFLQVMETPLGATWR